MEKRYVKVIVDITHESVDRPFEYRIPDELLGLIREGSCIRVPFGKANKEITAYVIAIEEEPEFPKDRLKDILCLSKAENDAQAESVALAGFLARNYGSTMIAALKTVIPVKTKVKEAVQRTVIRLCSALEAKEKAVLFEGKHQVAKARLLLALSEDEQIPYELLTGKLHIATPTIKSLESAGLIRIATGRHFRGDRESAGENKNLQLSPMQSRIVKEVCEGIIAGNPFHALIHGITGSGKTEVYLGIASRCAQAGKAVIMLIPEIALTYQTLMRFIGRFGDKVGIVHSKMSIGERYDQFDKARQGLISVMIGPRSALFTPFANLGAIIIDEEHETSYKSETTPKYHAREVAFEIARRHKASVILGSATPSLEAYHMAMEGEIHLYKLTERLTGGNLPKVDIVDLREELKKKNRSIFSGLLKDEMMETLLRGEQIMLFLNRRGIAGFVSCRSCGEVVKCPHCDVSLSQHRSGLVCHYCGYEEAMPTECPSCHSKLIAGFKVGTEQVEEAVKKLLPQARVLRMDADTTKSKDSYDAILSSFAQKEADILVGTQMIVKGHDFPDVTLVGILAADMSLNQADYRAGERTFDLLTQAAGRAGRGSRPGRVIIQTYQPDHYAIVKAAAQDYESFYEEEMGYREFMLYPPAAHMLMIRVLSEKEDICRTVSEKIKKRISKESEAAFAEKLLCIGPSPAGISRIKDVYRYVLYYRSESYEDLVKVKDIIENGEEAFDPKMVLIDYDFDPLNT